MDINKDGEISEEELKELLIRGKVNIDIDRLMSEVDLNENKKVNFSEFLSAFYDCHTSFQTKELEKLFRLIDVDGDGEVTK